MDPSAGTPAGARVVETRVYYSVQSGQAVHIHRLVVGAGQTEGDASLQTGVDRFDDWLRTHHDDDLDFIVVDEEALERAGPIEVDPEARVLKPPRD